MNPSAIRRNGAVRSGDDSRCCYAAASAVFKPEHRQRRESVVCPKPSRIARWMLSYEPDLADSKVRSELLDIVFTKGGHSYGNTQLVSSSPPFFCGSPPGRVSNPLIQDARFNDENPILPTITIAPSPAPPPTGSGSPMSPTSATPRKNGCVRASFGKNPAVRIEGFDCLDRDRTRNCRIPTLA